MVLCLKAQMFNRFIIMSLFAPLMAAGSALNVSANKLTDAISYAEVGDGAKMGKAGWHQMGEAAWADVTGVRKAVGKPTLDYSHTQDKKDSGDYCAHYLTMLYLRFKSYCGEPPKLDQLLAMYNIGFDGFKRHSFDTANLGNKFHDYVRKVKSKL